MSTPRLAFEAVACLRGPRLLFEGVSFALGPGAGLEVRGPNGAGKSSLLRIAAGLLRPVAGRIARTGRLALAGEAAALDPALPLGRALAFWAGLDGADPASARAAQAAMGVDALAPVPCSMLSTGQRRRAVLARTLAAGADIWLLDEPGNGLDAAGLDALVAAMAAHRARGGIVVAATHQPIGLTDPERIAL